MTKTYVASVPDHIGAFLQASMCFAELGINMTRVSYNKAVDSHTIFLDVEGTPEQLAAADKEMAEIGYLQNFEDNSNVVLVEFQLRDVPGGITELLRLIADFNFNISYMSSNSNGTEYQYFKIGLLITDDESLTAFLSSAEQLCPIRIIDYNRSERNFDNTIFYNSFVSSLIKASGISASAKNDLLISANLAMQMLDEQGLSPYRTFDSISKFAEMLAGCRGEAFSPRITRHQITPQTEIILIEPPCGSNTAIIHSDDEYLFVDSGYAYYRTEMLDLLRQLVPEFDGIRKRILITHADVDHCGLLPIFDEVIASHKSAVCLQMEYETGNGYRELGGPHKPYIEMCKLLTEYTPCDPSKVIVPWPDSTPEHSVLRQAGFFNFGDLEFEVYETRGGHLPGETVLIDYTHNIAFTGDVYVNIKGMTSEQRQYNQHAPILMTSVDTDPELCAQQRKAVFQRLGSGKWRIFGGHGGCAEYVPSEK
ncbi:MAG: MBL fold metallo-hydrolase [Oscillospiraceae bacterium]|nr:MBL fold metallo-hydrolase [Oscillospiraceae bacterium]